MPSGKRITNIDINKFFEYERNEDLKRKFMGVYSSDSITEYITFDDIIRNRKAKYPLAIFNRNRENKQGTHWWSFLDIYPKQTFYYLIVLVLLVLNNLL